MSLKEVEKAVPQSGRMYREDDEVVNQADVLEQSVGAKGFDVIADTNAWTPTNGDCYFALQFLASTVIDEVIAADEAPIIGTIAGVTFGAGTTLYGKFVSVKLTSGACLAYNGKLR